MALDHGFQSALYGLAGLLLAGALIAATFLRQPSAPSAEQTPEAESVPLEEAA